MSDLKTWVVTGPKGTCEVEEINEPMALCYAMDYFGYHKSGLMREAGYTATEKPREVTVRAEDLRTIIRLSCDCKLNYNSKADFDEYYRALKRVGEVLGP